MYELEAPFPNSSAPLKVLFPMDSSATFAAIAVGPRPDTLSSCWMVIPEVPPSTTSIPPLKPVLEVPVTPTVLVAAPSWPLPLTTRAPPLIVIPPEKGLTPVPVRRISPSPVSRRLPVPVSWFQEAVVPKGSVCVVSPETAKFAAHSGHPALRKASSVQRVTRRVNQGKRRNICGGGMGGLREMQE